MVEPDRRPIDERFLREAIRLSYENLQTLDGGPFGAVVVRDGEIVGSGRNLVLRTNDPTAHAEVVAIREAGKRLQSFSLAGCEIYCSCKPCPMCLAAILWARLDQVFYAADSEDAAEAGFDDQAFYRELEKPVDQRSTPMLQRLRAEARGAFQQWLEKEDRIDY